MSVPDLPPPQIPQAVLLRASARWLAAAATALGLMGLAGWVFGVPALKSVLPGLATMKANTALALVLEGAALTALACGVRGGAATAARAAAAAGGLIGALTLLEFALGRSLGIDEVLFRDSAASGLPYYAGRMAPTTALNFVLLAAALIAGAAPSRAAGRASEAAALAALGIAFMSLAGYVYRVRATGPVTVHTTQMAVHTSTAFLLLAVAHLLARSERGLLRLLLADDAGGLAARHLLPVAVGVPLVAGGLFLAGHKAGWYGAEFALAALVVTTVVALSAVIAAAARNLGEVDAERRRADAATRALNLELERRVSERTAELAAANRELEAFCYSISHDLSSPLQTVDGFAATIQKDCASALPDDAAGHLRRIRAAAQHMGRLIEALLELSRLTRADMRREDVDLSALARQIGADLAAAHPGRTVDLRVAPGLVARGDPRLLRTALENLLGNAWKFTARAAAAVVEFGAESRDGAPEFFVRDNGAGFQMSQAARLFSPFQRLHDPADFPGHGVGLATVQRVIQRHGGRIRAEGEPGKGAVFRFTLGT